MRGTLHHFFGPWKVNRGDVTLVYRELKGLDTFHALVIVGKEGLWWTFYTYAPDRVLSYLEELSYPIDPRARNGQGRFSVR
ncbi:hypothetical protein M1D88_02020 [Arthrobacter sp. R1-13]